MIFLKGNGNKLWSIRMILAISTITAWPIWQIEHQQRLFVWEDGSNNFYDNSRWILPRREASLYGLKQAGRICRSNGFVLIAI